MNINKEILKCIIEIITLICITVFTYPLMEIIGKSEGAKTAKYYDNYVNDKLTLYYEKKAELSNLYPVTEEYAIKKMDYTSINIVNNAKENKEYLLLLMTEKKSTLDTKYINININGISKKLNDLYYSENDYVKYFIINDDRIDKNDIKSNKIYIWLDFETPNTEQNKNLYMDYTIIDKINLVNS